MFENVNLILGNEKRGILKEKEEGSKMEEKEEKKETNKHTSKEMNFEDLKETFTIKENTIISPKKSLKAILTNYKIKKLLISQEKRNTIEENLNKKIDIIKNKKSVEDLLNYKMKQKQNKGSHEETEKRKPIIRKEYITNIEELTNSSEELKKVINLRKSNSIKANNGEIKIITQEYFEIEFTKEYIEHVIQLEKLYLLKELSKITNENFEIKKDEILKKYFKEFNEDEEEKKKTNFNEDKKKSFNFFSKRRSKSQQISTNQASIKKTFSEVYNQNVNQKSQFNTSLSKRKTGNSIIDEKPDDIIFKNRMSNSSKNTKLSSNSISSVDSRNSSNSTNNISVNNNNINFNNININNNNNNNSNNNDNNTKDNLKKKEKKEKKKFFKIF
jgi:hypothetical protein